MPIQLNKLAGAELLEATVTINKGDSVLKKLYELDRCAISIDKEKIVKIIKDNLKEALAGLNTGFWGLTDEAIDILSEYIASHPEKFLKIVRVSDEVKS